MQIRNKNIRESMGVDMDSIEININVDKLLEQYKYSEPITDPYENVYRWCSILSSSTTISEKNSEISEAELSCLHSMLTFVVMNILIKDDDRSITRLSSSILFDESKDTNKNVKRNESLGYMSDSTIRYYLTELSDLVIDDIPYKTLKYRITGALVEWLSHTGFIYETDKAMYESYIHAVDRHYTRINLYVALFSSDRVVKILSRISEIVAEKNWSLFTLDELYTHTNQENGKKLVDCGMEYLHKYSEMIFRRIHKLEKILKTHTLTVLASINAEFKSIENEFSIFMAVVDPSGSKISWIQPHKVEKLNYDRACAFGNLVKFTSNIDLLSESNYYICSPIYEDYANILSGLRKDLDKYITKYCKSKERVKIYIEYLEKEFPKLFSLSQDTDSVKEFTQILIDLKETQTAAQEKGSEHISYMLLKEDQWAIDNLQREVIAHNEIVTICKKLNYKQLCMFYKDASISNLSTLNEKQKEYLVEYIKFYLETTKVKNNPPGNITSFLSETATTAEDFLNKTEEERRVCDIEECGKGCQKECKEECQKTKCPYNYQTECAAQCKNTDTQEYLLEAMSDSLSEETPEINSYQKQIIQSLEALCGRTQKWYVNRFSEETRHRILLGTYFSIVALVFLIVLYSLLLNCSRVINNIISFTSEVSKQDL